LKALGYVAPNQALDAATPEPEAGKAVAHETVTVPGSAGAPQPAAAAPPPVDTKAAPLQKAERAQSASGYAAEDRLQVLANRSPSTVSEARQAREALRSLLVEFPPNPDDVRFELVRAGARAYQLSNDASDRDVLRHDAQAYLAQGTGRHRDQVQKILATLGP
jgi:hypothetical protein